MILVTNDINKRKTRLRLEMKGRRSSLSELERARNSMDVCENLWEFFEAHREKFIRQTIAVYLARPFEISIDPLISRLLNEKFTVAAPRVDTEKDVMDFWKLRSLEHVELGSWNVREPISDLCLVPQVMLVPGLAFDVRGGRLGTGGGWYDKTLERLERGAAPILKIGVCFEIQLTADMPREAHDLRVDYLASGIRFTPCIQPDP